MEGAVGQIVTLLGMEKFVWGQGYLDRVLTAIGFDDRLEAPATGGQT